MVEDRLTGLGIDLIPEPQVILPGEGAWRPRGQIAMVLPEDADAEDRFAAEDLADILAAEHGLRAGIGSAGEGSATVTLRRRSGTGLKPEGYRLEVGLQGVTVEGHDAAGLFWGTRTLLQAFRAGPQGLEVPCLQIDDWPDLAFRAVHYDTKHHQDTAAYVRDFIRTLAGYRINMLVWEWEDKLAYERHPEIGAPGAFTKEQMRELAGFARRHHVELVPLVQGLGHVSYILKHPQHRHLREIADSAWEFCPLKEGTYRLLFDLWEEAIEATPGGRFLHIGSDETYELGQGEPCGCRGRTEEIGREGLMHLFLRRAAEFVSSSGRRAMCWAEPPREPGRLPADMIFVDASRVDKLQAAGKAGYDTFVYAPNPGIEPLCLGYLPWVQSSMWRDDRRREQEGSFRDTAESIAAAGRVGAVLGSITTSWDDSGLHNQAWVPRLVCAAEFSWSARDPHTDKWIDRFLREYFGAPAADLRELFRLLQDGAIFYYDTFQRRVWHWGDLGMIHLPDFPRRALEYHPFWRRRYAQLLHRAADERQRVGRALGILDDNLRRPLRNHGDLEIYRTAAELMRHNADLVLMLGQLEEAIAAASALHFEDQNRALAQLRHARNMIEAHLQDRRVTYDNLVSVWERTRLPKGLSLPGKPYVFAPDRARHFANRTADMRYLILDEELLDLEGYLDRLRAYIAEYERQCD